MNKTAGHVLITGAGGGIGSALAEAFAGPDVHCSLWGRDVARLDLVAARCRAKGASTRLVSQDLRAFPESRALLEALDRERPVDRALFNAGVSSGTLPDGTPERAADACRTMEVNATAAINLAALLAERMAARGNGHLVFISSIAALYPLPDSAAYSASKIALAWYAKALRPTFKKAGVRISLVFPGYVDSPMSRRFLGPQPMRWSAERAAAHIRERLEAGSDTIIFPKLLALGALCLHILPAPAAAFFLRRFGFTIRPDAEAAPPAGRSGPGRHDA